ncbi:MAG: VWA domain-containing protein [Candidatus Schekmanbacteria bacterium]|nr:VWA domain-containing protein [Candidatus Schekmanbacteria bacterium]
MRSLGSVKRWGMRIGVLVLLCTLVLIITAPSLLRSRQGANEAAALGSLRTISGANVDYNNNATPHLYASSLDDLASGMGAGGVGFIDTTLAGGSKSGYDFQYASRPDGTYEVLATPQNPGVTGARSFLLDSTGRISQCEGSGCDPRGAGRTVYAPLPSAPPAPVDVAVLSPRREPLLLRPARPEAAELAPTAAPARPAPATLPAAPAVPAEPRRALIRRERTPDRSFVQTAVEPVSTFSIDVDTASYSLVRKFLSQGELPPPEVVRLEELINYFSYDYPEPGAQEPFAIYADVAATPWDEEHRLLRIALRAARKLHGPASGCSLVFLIDVSGSMDGPERLPLVKQALAEVVRHLEPADRIAIVTYAGTAGLVLDSTPAARSGRILAAIDGLQAGGLTAGEAGIRLAYGIARENFLPGKTNRVILATDGDFNVGIFDRSELTSLIRREADSGVALTALGFGMGNYRDGTLEALADNGDGNYAYIGDLAEARKVLASELAGTLRTIAKDVKIQVEFDRERVRAYRLLGYEDRALANRDFDNDAKDAGEIGAGHTVTAFYELVPAWDGDRVTAPTGASDEAMALGAVRLRYKRPLEKQSRYVEKFLTDGGMGIADAGKDFQFAAAVAEYGMLLRGAGNLSGAGWQQVLDLGRAGLGPDPTGARSAFVELAEIAARLDGSVAAASSGFPVDGGRHSRQRRVEAAGSLRLAEEARLVGGDGVDQVR